MKKLLLLIAIMPLFVACNSAKKDAIDASEDKYLVLYYSQTGTTKQLAEEIADLLGTDAVAFDVENPYDGTFEETVQRLEEEQQTDSLPPIKPLDVNLDDYQVIFLGYPIWGGSYATPVASLLRDVDLTNKTIVPFCTFGSGGLGSSINRLREALPDATVVDGYGVRAARIENSAEELEQFLIERGYLDGEVDLKAEYGPQDAVGEKEKEIFDIACGEYPMPIGTPITVGSRTTDKGIDYLYTVITKTPNGEPAEALVYVTCPSDGVPEFTRVER